MELQRTILILLFAAVSLLLWNDWQHEHSMMTAPPVTSPQPSVIQPNAPTSTASSSSPSTSIKALNTAPAVTNAAAVAGNNLISVQTDVLNAKISLNGGDLVGVKLLGYPETLHSQQAVTLLNPDPNNYYVAQSALLSQFGPDTATNRAVYTSSSPSYKLSNNQNSLDVALQWKNNDGLEVIKTYHFVRGEYLIQVNYQVLNKTSQAWQGTLSAQLTRKNSSADQPGWFQVHPYIGAAISSPEKRYQEISFKSMDAEVLNQTITNGWAAMVQHYFLSAWVPNPNDPYHYFTSALGNSLYAVGFQSQPIVVPVGQSFTTSLKLYVGPELTDVLKKIAPGLDLTVSYGWLWPVSVTIFWIMKFINAVVNNWGWSIILMTLLIKLLFYPLSDKSYRSMAGLRKLQPKIEALKEKHGEDKQAFSQAIMALYRSEKVNPLGGCLPILIQIPVFFALYMVLVETVQFRQAPWILWIHDLSSPDPLYVLPVIMGITMFIQQKLNPPPPDPVQAKMMMILPLIFTVLFLNFPAGLVLYWVVNNSLSILQQWYVTRKYIDLNSEAIKT